jgi:aminoglycoside phosphotransferase (APT) family kinase protein
MPDPTEVHLTVHQRDSAAVAAAIARWLPTVMDTDTVVEVSGVDVPNGAGMSSVTVLFDAAWTVHGAAHSRRLVARLAPDAASFPVFPSYDLGRQAGLLRAMTAAGTVPVPRVVGVEESGSVLGTPFLVMEAVEGRVPSDNPPYVFGGWLAEASPTERRQLQDSTVEAIARIHAVPASEAAGWASPGDALRAHVAEQRDYYAWACADDGVRVPVIERAFAWLEERWPADVSGDVLIWGDARPGNVLYDGFTPVAILDWEMAAVAPPEVDLGWLIFIHRFFQDIATVFELPGIPDFCLPRDVAETYARASGRKVADLHWFIVYAALRHAIVMARIKRRMIHFGEEQVPADPDGYVMHAASLAALMDGTYTWA